MIKLCNWKGGRELMEEVVGFLMFIIVGMVVNVLIRW